MTDVKDPLRNPLDPLHKAGPTNGRDLFQAIGRIASDAPLDAVYDAACNLLINALRQANPSWRQAEAKFDDLFGRSKQILKNHYDTVSGRKKGIFPYDQHVIAPLFHDPDGFHKM
jgi:hypothetical protein